MITIYPLMFIIPLHAIAQLLLALWLPAIAFCLAYAIGRWKYIKKEREKRLRKNYLLIINSQSDLEMASKGEVNINN